MQTLVTDHQHRPNNNRFDLSESQKKTDKALISVKVVSPQYLQKVDGHKNSITNYCSNYFSYIVTARLNGREKPGPVNLTVKNENT